MPTVVPGQTVYSRFTVSETPDGLPTVAVYKSTAAGVESNVTASVIASVAVVSGLAYRLAYTIEEDAVHGDTYSPLVSVVVGGESESRWISADVVDTKVSELPSQTGGLPGGVALATADGVLTAAQQATLDAAATEETLLAVKAKADLLNANTEIAVITGDLTLGDAICLYQGQDRTDDTEAPLRLVDSGGTVLPDAATPLVLRAVHHRPDGDSFDADGVVAVEGADKVAIMQVPGSLHASIDRGDYSYFVFKVVDGNLIALKIVGDLSLKLGPGVYAG